MRDPLKGISEKHRDRTATDSGAIRFESRGRSSVAFKPADSPDKQALAVLGAAGEGLVREFLHVKLSSGKKVKGKTTYQIRVVNQSPLILNGIALSGPGQSAERPPSVLVGIAVPPGESMIMGASASAVESLKLKEGVHVVAADLSGL